MKKFNDLIKTTVLERQVEDMYITELQKSFSDAQVVFPHGCDGIINTKVGDKDLKLICEFKYDKNLKSKLDRAIVLIQVLYYLKRFESTCETLPNICLIGDKNECFVFHINDIISFLDEDCDWTITPSAAYAKNQELLVKLADYDKLNPFVFNIDENFSFKIVAEKIKDLAANVQRYIHITEHNIDNIYSQFVDRVIKNSKKYNSKELVSIFLGILKDHENYFVHPVKKNTLCTPTGNIDINTANFESFFSYFQKSYSPKEIDNLTKIADRLIEDTERRNTGDFWTPTFYVDYAHKMISEKFGEDWKENYVVWDCACGSKNLTRDYKFKNLFCSTLFDSELEIGKDYNKESKVFQFDFLNDYFPMPNDLISEGNKVPDELVQALKENKPFIFFINPPYGSCGNDEKGISKGSTQTAINKDAINNKICAKDLCVQFLYRIAKIKEAYNLTNINVCCFTNPAWLISPIYKSFRNLWLKKFKFENGIMFKASEFADCSSSWGITFNMWTSGEQEEKNNFVHTLVEKNKDNEIIKIVDKSLYNSDNINFSLAKELKDKDGQLNLGSYSNREDVQHQKYVGIYTVLSKPSSEIITENNFQKVCAYTAARLLVIPDWTNNKDRICKPIEDEQYRQFRMDSIIYCLFSYQQSIKTEDKNIKNEFFWLSKEEMLTLANEYNNSDLYNDARTDINRFVYKFIEEHKLEFSQDALDVLEAASNLIRSSFKYRQLFNDEEPKYQINNWDCGWYQIKALCKMFCPDDLKTFMGIYKKFADKLRPQVYELGFLRK